MAVTLLSKVPDCAAVARERKPLLLGQSAGVAQALPAWDGKPFTLPGLHALLGCQQVELVPLSPELVLLIDADGKFTHPMNLLATVTWHLLVPSAAGRDYIAGPAILCHPKQFA